MFKMFPVVRNDRLVVVTIYIKRARKVVPSDELNAVEMHEGIVMQVSVIDMSWHMIDSIDIELWLLVGSIPATVMKHTVTSEAVTLPDEVVTVVRWSSALMDAYGFLHLFSGEHVEDQYGGPIASSTDRTLLPR